MRWTRPAYPRCRNLWSASGFNTTSTPPKWRVILYQRKTGEPVYCPLPPHVAGLLNTVPASQKGNTNERYFFWTGNGSAKTIVSNWQRTYKKVFALAGLASEMRCYPHMLRDTFAVEAILSGMGIDKVQMILGHSSIKVTEKHSSVLSLRSPGIARCRRGAKLASSGRRRLFRQGG